MEKRRKPAAIRAIPSWPGDKTRYRGLANNLARLPTLPGIANLMPANERLIALPAQGTA
jgi:hypothetical protein